MNAIPPGWYADPGAPQMLRWWDGYRWTDHVAPAYPGDARPVGPTTPDGEPLAGWWWRALAYLLDSLVTGVVSALVTLPGQIAVQRELNGLRVELERRVDAGQPVDLGDYFSDMFAVYGDHLVALVLLPVVVVVTYHAVFLRWKGATPGKLVCGLRVRRRAEPGRLPWSVTARRLLAQFGPPYLGLGLLLSTGSVLTFFLAWLAMTTYLLADVLWALGRRRQALHDVVAGTNVVRTR